jgi:hypothetical protein
VNRTWRNLALGLAVVLPATWFGIDRVAAADDAKNHKSVKKYHVKVKLKHYIDDAPDYTEYYWTTLYFYDDKWFDDGDFEGEWYFDDGGNEIHASVSDDYEDYLEWKYDDAEGWMKYTDIDVDGDEIRGRIKGEKEYEVDFFFFDEDYEEKFKGKFWGYEVDEWDDDDWGWWPW